MPKLKASLVLVMMWGFLLPIGSSAATYYASPTGGGTGLSLSSPATLAWAIATAKNGDTIGLMDGNYPVSQTIALPSGVNLSGVSQNASRVRIYPSANMSYDEPMLSISSVSPGSPGNQTVSYIQLDGTAGSSLSKKAIHVQNRNNVTIHHCDIKEFGGYSIILTDTMTIEIISTQSARSAAWWYYSPADMGDPGDDSTLDEGIQDGTTPTKTTPLTKYAWPSNPVENFQFHSNTVAACRAIGPFNLKNSSFHHNIIDNRETWGWCFKGTMAFLNNVDIYENLLLAYRQDEKGMINSVGKVQTPWNVELWMHRGGCDYYNNTMDGFYSITYGKETQLFNNIIVATPPETVGGTGIEFDSQNYGAVYGNYISGAHSGIRFGQNMANKRNWVVKHTQCHHNVIFDPKSNGIVLEINGAQDETGRIAHVNSMFIYNNVVDGQTSAERGDTFYRGTRGIYIIQKDNLSASEASDIYVKNNIVIDITGYAGDTDGIINSYGISHNQFYNNTPNSWSGSTATDTGTANPLFAKPRIDFSGYALQTTPVRSPCIDSGVNVGLPYHGSAPDRGAIESGTAPAAPLAPRGLTVK